MTSDGPRRSRDEAESGRQETSPVVLVDGSNVAHSSEAEQPLESIMRVARALAAAATATSACGWKARIDDTADRYNGLAQCSPSTRRDMSRCVRSAKRRARIW